MILANMVPLAPARQKVVLQGVLPGTLVAVTQPDVQGLEQLEAAVLDNETSLASALRRCLMLGGYAHHKELRTWALKELEGYAADDDLPAYRKVSAALEINANVHGLEGITQYSGRRISPHLLPSPAKERGVGEVVPILYGVKELEGLIARAGNSIFVAPPGSAEYVLLMTLQYHEAGNKGTEITSLHWDVAVASIEGILDRIRTRLTQFVAEVRASMPPGQQNPNPAQIGDAAERTFSISAGDGATVNINAPRAHAERGATASANINEPVATPERQPFWHRTSVIWTAVGAVAAVASVIIAWVLK
ncbi:hypothetical protein OG782_00150 [Streptomyces sp. NBC_00876]|uniref:AbiTii domain-containing protein n=1 Tax=Streptomyces sp. NBC_00876 TaxID=2975853 RepID=UPI00386CFA1F|nr:hypothetical protein OG782_00150 [Streptomyces sp. NBC_00876]